MVRCRWLGLLEAQLSVRCACSSSTMLSHVPSCPHPQAAQRALDALLPVVGLTLARAQPGQQRPLCLGPMAPGSPASVAGMCSPLKVKFKHNRKFSLYYLLKRTLSRVVCGRYAAGCERSPRERGERVSGCTFGRPARGRAIVGGAARSWNGALHSDCWRQGRGAARRAGAQAAG